MAFWNEKQEEKAYITHNLSKKINEYLAIQREKFKLSSCWPVADPI